MISGYMMMYPLTAPKAFAGKDARMIQGAGAFGPRGIER